MFLKRLDLSGFKSFAPHTTTELQPGIVVVVGPNGSGKCLTGDALVTLADGREVPIGELVESTLTRVATVEVLDDGVVAYRPPGAVHVLSLDTESLRLQPRHVVAFVKRRAPGQLVRIRTRSGRAVTTTPYHPLFSLINGRVSPVPAGELRIGLHVALPRRLPTQPSDAAMPGVWSAFQATDNVFVPSSDPLRAWVRTEGKKRGTIMALAREAQVSPMQLRGLLDGQAMNAAVLNRLAAHASAPPPVGERLKSRGRGHLRAPTVMTPRLAWFLGLLVAEGVNRSTNQVRIVNSDDHVSTHFANLAGELFAIAPASGRYKPNATDTLLYSATLGRVLARCFGFGVDSRAADKVVPPQILHADSQTKWAFLSGLFEGDAYVANDGTYLEYTTASSKLAHQVVGLLLQLGVFASIRSKQRYAANTRARVVRTYYSVLIYGRGQLRVLGEKLSFVGAKERKLALLKRASARANPNHDLVPQATLLVQRAVQIAHVNVKRYRSGRAKLAAYSESRCSASRDGLLEVCDQIEELGVPGSASDELQTLRTLATSDIYWDPITSVDYIEPADEWVYDLCIERTHNFVANNVIVHNSNIADSVRWVLGEQSAKAVRARKPEEVIFAGSATRQPLGMAEASLVLDNSDGSLPIEYGDVRVTRRLYRSGDSEYLLNGAKVRLKDITQLLLHAGLSPDSYTVIGQGSIDELILQRPEERRIAFESAADIRRHQLRLNETHSRLSTTEMNLTRVQDVIAELAPHVRRLKSQAERAARADAFRAELHDLLLRYFRLRLARARAERHGADRELQLAAQAAERAEAETSASEQALSQLDTALAALDEQLAVLRPRAASYREQAAATERALAVTRERAAGTQERRAALNADVARQSNQLQRLVAEQAAHAAEPGVESPVASEQDVELARTRLDELQHSLTGARADRQQSAAADEAAQLRAHDLESQLAELERELHALEAAQAVEEARATDRAARLQMLGEEFERLQREETALRDEAQRANSQREAASERHATASEAERAAAETLREASQHADRLHGAYAALGIPEDAETARMPDRWRDLLSDLPVVGLAGELASRIRPIDRLLHAYLRRIVVLRDDPGAREAHRRLASALGDQEAAWAVLSLDGLLLTPGGETPLEPADEAASGLADWRRQVRQLEQQLHQAEATRAAAMQAHSKATEERQTASEADQAVREASNIATTELEQRLRSRRIVESELQELRVEQQRGAAVLEQRSAERNELAVRLEALSVELSQARQKRERAHEATQEHEQLVATLQQQLSHAQANLLALEARQSKRQVERAAQQALRERIGAEIGTTRDSLAVTHQQLDQLDQQASELGEREAQLIEELQATLLALAPIEQELSGAELQRMELQATRRTEETRLAELRTTERLAREDREERHVQAQRTADELERLHAEIDETAELEQDTGGGGAQWAEQLRLGLSTNDAEPPEPIDLEPLRRRITTLQRELRAVGGVAESVVDEFRELSERHDFLNNQSDDLRVAMIELHQAAAELEAHMRERFSAVFEATQEAFQECFGQLFGGGEARLVLTEPDDLLRTGVDIVARPPGKKLQGLLSLSGGERALTIVALLFGLLRVNPTPFCVLDEVDAALDEANVQRFANLLADFARAIQFVVVTHNRATMDRADALYGVSMDADGISRIFSIKPSALVNGGDSAQASNADRRPPTAGPRP